MIFEHRCDECGYEGELEPVSDVFQYCRACAARQSCDYWKPIPDGKIALPCNCGQGCDAGSADVCNGTCDTCDCDVWGGP